MGMTVTLIADDAAGTSYTLVGSSSPWKLTTANWGNAVWDMQFTGPRGTLGPRVAASTVGNRQVALGLRLLPESVDAGSGHQKDLNEQVSLMHRVGGRIRVEHSSQTYRQYLVAYAGSAAMQDWTNRSEFAGRVDYALTFVCDPYVHADPMRVTDDFSTDTLTRGDWVSVPSGFTVSGGALNLSTSANGFLIHNAWGHRYGDQMVSCTFTWAAVVNGLWSSVILKWVDASNYLYAGVYDDGAASTLYVGAYIAGVNNSLASQALTRIEAGRPFRVVGQIQGDRYVGSVYPNATYADFQSGGTSTTAVILTGTAATLFGHSGTGRPGINADSATPVTAQTADDFDVQPFAYTNLSSAFVRQMDGVIPGDAPALVETEVLIGTGTATPTFAAASLAQVADRNYVENGDFESGTVGSAPPRPWSVAAVTGVTGAATSITTRSTAAKYGSQCAEVVCPATANTGATVAMFGPFYAGRTYTMSCWVRAASATTNARIRLGVNGDISSSTAAALSATWSQRTVTWTATTGGLIAYACVEITAATATTFQVDAVEVYEDAPTLPSQQRGRGGAAPIGFLAPDTSNYGTAPTTGLASWPYPTTAGIRAATGSVTTCDGRWLVDPATIEADPHTGQVAVEVWAYIVTPGTLSGGYARAASVGVLDTQWTQEYGSTGLPLGTSSSNLYRLGTIQLNASSDARQQVYVQCYWSSGSGDLDIAFVMLLPAARRFAWPTGKSATGYPTFGYGSGAMLKRLTADGQGAAKIQTGVTANGFARASGHGFIFTCEPGTNYAAFMFTNQIPNTTASAASNPQVPLLLNFNPTPRWHQLRDE